MKELKFKTNINCNGCLSKVRPVLDNEDKIDSWGVDLQNDNRTLTVRTENMLADEVRHAIGKLGFSAEIVTER